MAARIGMAEKLFERFFYDFSLYRLLGLNKKMEYSQYVLARHNFTLLGGFYGLLTFAMPFNPPFPTMGMCPKGYEGTWVCEHDHHKALEGYKQWKETGKLN